MSDCDQRLFDEHSKQVLVIHSKQSPRISGFCSYRLPALIQGDACVNESVAGLLFLLEQHGELRTVLDAISTTSLPVPYACVGLINI